MKLAKLTVRGLLIIQLPVFVYLFVARDAVSCIADCMTGPNVAITYVLPVILLTVAVYLVLVMAEKVHHKK